MLFPFLHTALARPLVWGFLNSTEKKGRMWLSPAQRQGSSNSPQLRSLHGAGAARCPQTWWSMGLAGHLAAGQSQ